MSEFSSGWFPTPRIKLVTSPEDFVEAQKAIGFADPQPITGAPGCTIALDGSDGDHVIIVYVRPNDDQSKMLEMLVHEAVHAKQFWMRNIGEDSPSMELEAYAVQSIFIELFSMLADAVGEPLTGGAQ